jgi:putative transferase (TIGR04331 family)
MPNKRFLVTTSDERSWKFDRPLLFLGEWCRLYDRKQIWEGMDAVVAEPYGLKTGQVERDITYVQTLSSQLLTELVEALNTFHATQHSMRYWQIVLGHWLQRYVAVIFNRYFTLEQALKEHEVSGTTIFESAGYSLATTDSMTFIWACNDDVWNHVLYSKILSYWGSVGAEVEAECISGVSGFVMKKNSFVREACVMRFTLDVVSKMLHKLSRVHDAFIISSYLPLKEEIKLQLSLWQCPQLWRSPKLKAVAPDMEMRQSFRIDAENYTGFEQFVRYQLPAIIPSCYLEGYSQLVHQVESLPWPSNPRFIFTSNGFDTDEIFKAWAGAVVEQGVPYFAGQHGNNYGTHVQHGNQHCPERTAVDKFITWGWADGNPNNVPGFVFTLAGRTTIRLDTEGGLLLIELHSSFRLDPEDSYFKFGIYQQEQFRFFAALPVPIQQKLTVRLHSACGKHRWSDEQRWKDFSPHTKIETGSINIKGLIARSRLVVHSYDSTGILETLALNIPTVCFWHGGLDHLLPDAKPYYELLRKANILADTPEQAAELIALHWDNISEWWGSQKVQDARKVFCDQYSRIEKKPVRTLKRLLTMHANQGSSK